jgi:hypothetical protein
MGGLRAACVVLKAYTSVGSALKVFDNISVSPVLQKLR